MNIRIREGSPGEMVSLSKQIPELENPYEVGEYKKRITGKNNLLLLAEVNGKPAGFKAAYEWDPDTFYSWMGGVLPEYRNKGIAKALSAEQEKRIRIMGYSKIRIKTRNRHKAMIQLLVKEGFFIVDLEKKGAVNDFRVIFEKKLTNPKQNT